MATTHHPADTYPIRAVPMSRPFVWLSEGWDDLMHHRGASLAYGALVSILGALILAYARHPFFITATIVGFMLVGPILGAGLCELSRCRATGERADFQSSLRPLQRNRASLIGLAETLMLITVIWFAVSGAIYYGIAGSVAPEVTSTIWGDVLRQLSSTQMLTYGVIGITLSAIVFAVSVIAVPMIVERHVDAATAMRTSLHVTTRDLPAMIVWAALIVGLVVLGFATGLVAMVVIYPLLGHATWRAYQELVE